MNDYIIKNFTFEELLNNKQILNKIAILSNIAYLDPTNKAKDNYKISSLLRIIQNRFNNNGVFSLLYDKNKLIGFAGAYKHTNDILICLVRTYIIKQYRGRNILANILSYQIKYANQNNYKLVWITFNDYNKNIYDMILK